MLQRHPLVWNRMGMPGAMQAVFPSPATSTSCCCEPERRESASICHTIVEMTPIFGHHAARGSRSRFAVAVLLTSSLAGAQTPKQPTLPACKETPLATPSSWVRKEIRDTFSLALPACFETAKPERRFIHGGTTWKCPPAGAEIVWGMWGPTSFDSRGGCTTFVAGVPAVVVHSADTRGTSLMVWYRTGTIHEPLISAWSPRPKDRESVLQIVYSGRVAARK